MTNRKKTEKQTTVHKTKDETSATKNSVQ